MDFTHGIPSLPLPAEDSTDTSSSNSSNDFGNDDEGDEECMMLLLMALHLYVTLQNLF